MKCIRRTLLALTILPVISMAQPTAVLVEQKAVPGAGNRLAVTVEVRDVGDLDTYLASISYDRGSLRLIDAALDAPIMNINNVLRSKGRTLLPVIKKEEGAVSIAATLSGEKPSATSESGVIGILMFEVLNNHGGRVRLENVELLDSKGKKIECAVASN
jgi:hypothetical protein